MRAWLHRAATMLPLWIAGCPDPGDYACVDDTDCDRAGQFGQCLADRACGYPVPTERCPSGLIRSPNAATDPGGCVPLETETGTGSTSSPSSSSATSSGDSAPSSSTSGPQVCNAALVSLDLGARAEVGYPLLLELSDPDVVASIREHAPALSVSAADGTQLAVEWMVGEDPDPVRAWVRLQEPANAHTLRIGWGPDDAPSTDGVWTEYGFVWHFDAPGLLDAVGGGALGSPLGDVSAEQYVPAMIGPGLRFDGVDDGLELSPAPADATSPFTFSFWARVEQDTGAQMEYFSSLSGHSLHPRCFRNAEGGTNCQTRDSVDTDTFGGPSHPIGDLRHIALVRDASGLVQLFIDGEAHGDTTLTDNAMEVGPEPLLLASGQFGPAPLTLDEVRFSPRALSASWLALDADVQRDPASVVTDVELQCD